MLATLKSFAFLAKIPHSLKAVPLPKPLNKKIKSCSWFKVRCNCLKKVLWAKDYDHSEASRLPMRKCCDNIFWAFVTFAWGIGDVFNWNPWLKLVKPRWSRAIETKLVLIEGSGFQLKQFSLLSWFMNNGLYGKWPYSFILISH